MIEPLPAGQGRLVPRPRLPTCPSLEATSGFFGLREGGESWHHKGRLALEGRWLLGRRTAWKNGREAGRLHARRMAFLTVPGPSSTTQPREVGACFLPKPGSVHGREEGSHSQSVPWTGEGLKGLTAGQLEIASGFL